MRSSLFRFHWLYIFILARKELMISLSVVPEVWVLTVLLVESRLCVLMRKSLIFVRQWSIVPYCVCQPEINPQRHVVVMNTAPWERDTVSTVGKKLWKLVKFGFSEKATKFGKKSWSYFWEECRVLCVQQRTFQKVDKDFFLNVVKSYYTNFNYLI